MVHTRQFRRLKRATLAGGSLVFVFAAVLTPTGTAYAGAPFEATSYQGATAHGRYTQAQGERLGPSCVKGLLHR